jgi:hypothetical protein
MLNQFVTSSTPKNERDKDKKFVGPSYCLQWWRDPRDLFLTIFGLILTSALYNATCAVFLFWSQLILVKFRAETWLPCGKSNKNGSNCSISSLWTPKIIFANSIWLWSHFWGNRDTKHIRQPPWWRVTTTKVRRRQAPLWRVTDKLNEKIQ